MMIANMQKEAAMAGLPIVQPQNFYETAKEVTKAADFSQPERFWTEPSKAPPQQPPQPDVTVVAAEQIKSQTQVQTRGAEIEKDKQVAMVQEETKRAIAELQSQTQLQIEQMRREHEAAIESFRARHAVDLKGMDAEQTAFLDTHRNELKQKPATDMAKETERMAGQLQQSIDALQGALGILLNSKRQIRRGKDGKAEGVDVISPDGNLIASKSIQRASDGRIIGEA
jgi:hypothetical protein